MSSFWFDKTAIVTALIGLALIELTIAWNINLVEASVIPDYVPDVVRGILGIASLPVLIVMLLCPDPVLMMVLQTVL